MIAAILCIAAFVASCLMARRSPAAGLITLLATGYSYGIVRANLLGGSIYFLFDCAVAGFYLGYKWRPDADERRRTKDIGRWLYALIGWPLVLAVLPFQTPLVTLVGLRGNIFFLPLLYVGARLHKQDLIALSTGLALLNLVAAGMAGLEYVKGVQAFYPENAVTQIIYRSNDVANYQYLRIPAIFANAHAFGGTMVATLPFLFGAWEQRCVGRLGKLLLLAGILAASAGTLLAAARVPFIALTIMGIAAMAFGKSGWRSRCALGTLILLLAGFSTTSERLQRFKSLGDSSMITERIGGSVNRTFFEVLLEYPMGNGLGGGGTSIPQFLERQLRRPVSIESEYGRILLEQGLIGLLIWLAFIFWFLSRSTSSLKGEWQYGRKLAFIAGAVSIALGLIGVGMLTSIPQTVLLALSIGWVTSPLPGEELVARLSTLRQPCVWRSPV